MKPTEPGWYWYQPFDKFKERKAEPVEVGAIRRDLCCSYGYIMYLQGNWGPRIPEWKPEFKTCDTCIHLQGEMMSTQMPCPGIWCNKGHFDGIQSVDELSEPTECVDWRSERMPGNAIDLLKQALKASGCDGLYERTSTCVCDLETGLCCHCLVNGTGPTERCLPARKTPDGLVPEIKKEEGEG